MRGAFCDWCLAEGKFTLAAWRRGLRVKLDACAAHVGGTVTLDELVKVSQRAEETYRTEHHRQAQAGRASRVSGRRV